MEMITEHNTSDGDGVLSTDAPGDEPADSYTYVPRDPVPTVGGAIMLDVSPTEFNTGPMDQRKVEARTDVLCYTTPPLALPVEVIGPIELALFVSSSAPDTDFTAKLVDVYPDGRAEILCDGILRARYRESLTAPVLMEPGQVYELRIAVGATANVFRAGHSIRLEVSSSNFPRFDRNSNTGRAHCIRARRGHGCGDQPHLSRPCSPVAPDPADHRARRDVVLTQRHKVASA